MDIISLPSMISCILTFFLACLFLIIYTKRKDEKEYLYFSIICFASFILSGANCLSTNSINFQQALFWERFMHIGVAMIIPASVQFALSYIRAKNDLLRKFSYGMGTIVLCISFTNLLVQDTQINPANFTDGGTPGLLYPFYAILLLLLFSYLICMLWNSCLRSTDKQYRRLTIPILTGIILYVACGLTETAMVTFRLPFCSVTEYGPAIFCLFISYALIDKFALTCERLDASINNLRQAQEKLVRSERLSAIGEMAAKVVHEIKNPLTGIRFLTELCQRDLPENDQKISYGKEVLVEVDRLNKFLSRFLDLAKPAQLNLRPVEMEGFIDRLLSILPEIKQRQIRVEISVVSGLGPIYVDPDQMKQAFLNLILNGIQSMQDGGVLRIRIEKVHHPESVLMEISDTGEGIEEEDLCRIFDTFFTTKENGTGLGLSITQKIIDAHGGSIVVKSKRGEGSTFTIQIPCNCSITCGSRRL